MKNVLIVLILIAAGFLVFFGLLNVLIQGFAMGKPCAADHSQGNETSHQCLHDFLLFGR